MVELRAISGNVPFGELEDGQADWLNPNRAQLWQVGVIITAFAARADHHAGVPSATGERFDLLQAGIALGGFWPFWLHRNSVHRPGLVIDALNDGRVPSDSICNHTRSCWHTQEVFSEQNQVLA
jgi:hypothetical protein